MPFDKEQPFKNLGIRFVKGKAGGRDLRLEEVELTMNEYSSTVGIDQMLKHGKSDATEE